MAIKAIAVVSIIVWLGLSIGRWVPVFQQAIQSLSGGH